MGYREVKYNDLDLIREWRNSQLSMLRTPYLLTVDMQVDFYKEKICNRNSNCRFFSIEHGVDLVGMVGLENIQFENRLAEISLVTDPNKTNMIEAIAKYILKYGFNFMNLNSIFAEVYQCNPNFDIWMKLANEFKAAKAVIPFRKFYDERYFDSTIFTFSFKD